MDDRKLQLELPQEEEENSVMLSIGDLMSGLLMVFALLFIIVFVQYQVALEKSKELEREVQQYEKAFRDLPEIIRSQLEKAIGKGSFSVDPKTGDLQIGDRILFDEDSSTLNTNGKAFLRQFIPAYSKIIFSKELNLDSQVTRISVEGSTSSSGRDRENMDLSLRRASAVYQYIFNDPSFPKFETKDRLREKMLVAGRGALDSNKTTVDPTDRRVTFRFQVRRPNFLESEKP
ncbi:OmpA/MotB family protein [Pseudanabaena mucicola]|uniref:OmpA family protein n=1 Tax=Pseudanabaena mucicola FACHB-723 TaxID=2692860 RepID=A0ABR8A1A9_9CYAN|nr:OmpA family protein [Pseudanabaena mucicola]MBD2190022.1 OmpA family protein [Pseudanabaena mucicola FACHB-723]